MPFRSARRSNSRLTTALRLQACVAALALMQLQWTTLARGGALFATASAQGIANSMTVLVLPAKPKEADLSEALERLLLASAARLELVRAFSLSPLPGDEDGEQCERLVEEALRALLLRTPKRATERVGAALTLIAKTPAVGDTRLHARLAKAQALIALAGNELVQARDALTRSLVLFPGQAEEEYVAYGSQAVELYKAVKGSLAQAPTGDLEVTAKAQDAEVYVDGTYRGRAPTKIEELTAGEHRVMLRRAGSKGDRRMVKIEAGKALSLDVELAPASFGDDLASGRQVIAANFGQPNIVEDRIRELRNQVGVDQILVVRAVFSKTETTVAGFFLGSDGVFKKVNGKLTKDADYFDAAARLLGDAAGAKVLPDPSRAPLDQRKSVVVASQTQTTEAARTYIDPNEEMFKDKKQGEEPLTSKWWFWAAVGGGVAALVGGGIWLASDTASAAQGATGTVEIKLHKASGN